MTAAPSETSTAPPARRPYWTWLLTITATVVAARLLVLAFTPLDLFYDEAQYWFWSLDPALGYFSKPPLIAWLIGATTGVCGTSEGCIRAAAPVLHGVTTLCLFGLGRALYDARTAFFAALAYLFAIAVSASSLLISTDVPLLLCWVLGLWAFAHYVRHPSAGLALGFGVAIAVGLNAKYAMIYFPICLVAYLVLTADKRALMKRLDLWGGLAVGMLGFLPNLIWNIQNDFITFSHTGENISGSGFSLNPVSFLEFFGSQFGVAGPVLFAAFLLALARGWRSDKPDIDRLLIFFCVPILLLLGFQAFQSSANYNWAATAYPALILVTTAILMATLRQRWVRWNLAICMTVAVLFAGGALAILALRPDHPIVSRTNLEDMFGWAEHADEIGHHLDLLEPDTVVTVGRRYAAGFAYYMRARDEPMHAFKPAASQPRNHFEFIAPWTGSEPTGRTVILSPGNVRPVPDARLVGVVNADDGAAPFRSNSYLFLVDRGDP